MDSLHQHSMPRLPCVVLQPVFQADQLVVQGMMASRYLAQFEEVVSGWQTQLSMVRYDIEKGRPWVRSKIHREFERSSPTLDIILPVFFPSDVFTILQEIQRTWSYLEPLFIGSEEVKKELPEDAKRFEGIDTDVKRLLKSVSRTLPS